MTFARAAIETCGDIDRASAVLEDERNGPAIWDSPGFEDVVRAAEAG